MDASLKHLFDITNDRTKFADALLVFCQELSPTMPELKKLLMRKMMDDEGHL